jgi:tetratricopeptide (TPR) repeat protein
MLGRTLGRHLPFGGRAVHVALLLGVLSLARLARAEGGAGEALNPHAEPERPSQSHDSDAARARALELFEQSSKLYDQGDFAGAIALLDQAYAAFPEPVILYNLGRTHEGLGNDEAAISAYEKYLAAQPDAKDRGAIARRVQTLRERSDERHHAAARAKQPCAPLPSPAIASNQAKREDAGLRPPYPRALPWVITGVGALGLSGGAALWFLAKARHDQAQNDADVGSAQNDQNEARSLAQGASVALVIGGVLTAAGAAWGIVTLLPSPSKAQPMPHLSLAIGAGTVWISGRL